MIVVTQIKYIFDDFVKAAIAVIVDGSLNVLKEILKFILILLIVYYFAIWSFQFLNDVLQDDQNQNHLNTKTDLGNHQIVEKTGLRVGPPDENLIKQRASLLEQLEIEAEFEEYQDKLIKSEADLEQFVKKEIHKASLKTRDSDDIIPLKNQFISQMKQELNETSRASQTLKTSLGKKSKLRENSENRPSTSHKDNYDQKEEDLLGRLEPNNVSEIKQEILSEHYNSRHNEPRSSKSKRLSKTNEEMPSFDDQYDHESFHRV